jgi:hypothetical protein
MQTGLRGHERGLQALQMRSKCGHGGWAGGCSHLMAQSQINHRKSTRPWCFHKTTGGRPGATFFGPPDARTRRGPVADPHRGPFGELWTPETKWRRRDGAAAGERKVSKSRYYNRREYQARLDMWAYDRL